MKLTCGTSLCTLESSVGAQLTNTCKMLDTVDVLTDENLARGDLLWYWSMIKYHLFFLVWFTIADEDLIGIWA